MTPTGEHYSQNKTMDELFTRVVWLQGEGSTTPNTTLPGIRNREGPPHLSSHEYIILISTPIIVILGTIGNALSGFIMLRRRFRGQSTSVYLVALAVSDTMFLYANSMSKNFIKVLFHANYSITYPHSCAVYVYFLLVSKCLSAWFIVAVTTERLIVVCSPLNGKILATRRRAIVTVTSLTFAILALYSFVLPSFARQLEDDGKIGCAMRAPFRNNNVDIILKVFDMVVYSILPSGILFTCNVLLVYKVVQSGRFRRRTASVRRRESDRTTGAMTSMGQSKRLTITLLLVSCVYLILTFPMTAFLSYAAIVETVPHYQLTFRSLYTLQLTNSALNFLLYTSGPAFRDELSRVCCWGRSGSDSQQEASKRVSLSPRLSLFSTDRRSALENLPSPASYISVC